MRNTTKVFVNEQALAEAGLTTMMLQSGIEYVYSILDLIDTTLIENGAYRLSQMMELANLSTFIGNLLGAGIANASQGVFKQNGPHKYPDILAQLPSLHDVEIKVAIENNKPKAHQAKQGYYLTCRYVLADEDGTFSRSLRGEIVWIWELRIGLLEEQDFNKSNTEGDSGKTAVVNKAGMQKLRVVFCDLERIPFSPQGKTIREYQALYVRQLLHLAWEQAVRTALYQSFQCDLP